MKYIKNKADVVFVRYECQTQLRILMETLTNRLDDKDDILFGKISTRDMIDIEDDHANWTLSGDIEYYFVIQHPNIAAIGARESTPNIEALPDGISGIIYEKFEDFLKTQNIHAGLAYHIHSEEELYKILKAVGYDKSETIGFSPNMIKTPSAIIMRSNVDESRVLSVAAVSDLEDQGYTVQDSPLYVFRKIDIPPQSHIFKTLTTPNVVMFVDSALLHKGIYGKVVPDLYSMETTMETLVENAVKYLMMLNPGGMTESQANDTQYMKNLRNCELTVVSLTI